MASSAEDGEAKQNIIELFRRAVEYWTPERTKSAISCENLEGANALLALDSTPNTLPTCGVTDPPSKSPSINASNQSGQSDRLEQQFQTLECGDSQSMSTENRGVLQEANESNEIAGINAEATSAAEIATAPDTQRAPIAMGAVTTEQKTKSKAAPVHPSLSEETHNRGYVKNSSLKEEPYKSIGKLYVKLSSNDGKEKSMDMNVTAFYIGQPASLKKYGHLTFERLLTVAHVFEKYNSIEHMLFLPASNPDNENKNDKYFISHREVHPDYLKGRATCDLCVLYAWPHQLSESLQMRLSLQPLQLAVNLNLGKSDVFQAIGYRCTNRSRQYFVKGNFLHGYMLEDEDDFGPKTIAMDTDASGGMSGGPWICQHPEYDTPLVIGIQSRINMPRKAASSSDHYHRASASPHFTRSMLKRIGLEVHYDL